MQKQIQIRSVQYVYDPEAAKKWFELWTNIVQEELMNNLNKPKESQDLEDTNDEIDRRVLPEFDQTTGELG